MKPELRQRISGFIDRNKALFLLSYFAIYLPWFGHLEKTVTTHFHVIHTALDDYIPFCEYFIIPYLLWFGYVGWGIAVTPDGPELIEGNWHWPGGNIIQFDGVGKYPLLRDCAGETDEEHPH